MARKHANNRSNKLIGSDNKTTQTLDAISVPSKLSENAIEQKIANILEKAITDVTDQVKQGFVRVTSTPML